MAGEKFDEILQSLYECGTDPQWVNHSLRCIGDAFNSHLTAIHIHDLDHSMGHLEACVGAGSIEVDRIFRRYGGAHLWFESASSTLLKDGVCDDRGLVPADELEGTEFFQVFLRGIETRYGMAFNLASGADAPVAAITVNRDRRYGSFRADELRFAKRLLPHVRNVYRLQQQLSWAESVAAGFRAALDHLDFGVCLLDKYGAAVFSNPAAQRLCAEQSGITQVGGRLRVVWHPDQDALKQAIDRACAGLIAASPQPLPLHDKYGTAAAMLLLLPVPPMTTMTWSEPRTAVVAFIKPLKSQPKAAADTLRTLFGLTAAETQLAVLLSEGLTLRGASERMGKSINTVRSQLRALLAKTNARRQAELLQLIANLTKT